MIEVKVYNDIANKNEAVFMSMFGLEDCVFSADTVKHVFADNKNETDFKFSIHCNGGSVSEGLAIYDIIRTSGKTIHTNIEGSCHSMAICILLSAPFENRTANQNSRSLIHKVRAYPYDALTAEEARTLASVIENEENAILDIYADRTGKNKAALKAIMKAEKERTAQELLDLGFISKINSYNTNLKNGKKMAVNKTNKKPTIGQRIDNFLTNAKRLTGSIVNYDYTDSEDNVLFSTEAEEDTLAVGDTVTIPDGSTEGTFELPDGRVVTVVDNVVTDIEEASSETGELQTENAELKNSLAEAMELITELQNKVTSKYTPAGRTANAGTRKPAARTKEDLKNEAAAKRKTFKDKK